MKKKKRKKSEEIEIETMENRVDEIVQLPMDKLKHISFNVNEMESEKFSSLVASIEEEGLYEPLLVNPIEDGFYEIIHGNHRYESIKLLGWEKAPCIIREEIPEDSVLRSAIGTKLNTLRGSPNSAKFTQLYNELAKKVGEERAKIQMGSPSEKLFKQLYIDIRKSLPDKKMKKEFAERAKEVESVDEIQEVLQSMLEKFGGTIDSNYMILTYGGKTHLWLKLDQPLKIKLNKIVEKASTFEINLTEYFNFLFNLRNSVFKRKYGIDTEDIESSFLESEIEEDKLGKDAPVYKKENRKGKYKKKKDKE